mmetsp:Transcript_119728/g.298637  ORF Transcript_119728/g.298637 Transcript_119728/m.298637 type:complete len:248 (-) Transcript_119728:84-827(-)
MRDGAHGLEYEASWGRDLREALLVAVDAVNAIEDPKHLISHSLQHDGPGVYCGQGVARAGRAGQVRGVGEADDDGHAGQERAADPSVLSDERAGRAVVGGGSGAEHQQGDAHAEQRVENGDAPQLPQGVRQAGQHNRQQDAAHREREQEVHQREEAGEKGDHGQGTLPRARGQALADRLLLGKESRYQDQHHAGSDKDDDDGRLVHGGALFAVWASWVVRGRGSDEKDEAHSNARQSGHHLDQSALP